MFALSVALLYGMLVSLGVAFGFFFALSAVCGLRGIAMWAGPRWKTARESRAAAPAG